MKRRTLFQTLFGGLVAAFFARCEIQHAKPTPVLPGFPTDINGREILPGDLVQIHHTEEEVKPLATVVESDQSRPTFNEPGRYVEVEDLNGSGRYGIMSYIVEVIPF